MEMLYSFIKIAWRCGGGIDVDVLSGTSCENVAEDGRIVRPTPGRHHVKE